MGSLYGRVKIELMSDLCVGSGYSYAGVIDTDVSYDEHGLPFIPARRLKGCMREAAQLVCPDAAEAMFGKAGDNGMKGIVLWNAHIEGYASIAEELGRLEHTGHKEAAYLSPQNILKIYTAVRAQTKLCQDTGVAERNSLRYTRVVGQYNPLKEKTPLCFYAKIEFDDSYKVQLERVMKATRNIGMNRNRGLGSVRCTLVDIQERKKTESAEGSGEERVCLTYILCNQEPLLMSSDNAETSDSYISGKSILGNLAGAWLCGGEKNAEEEEFRELFLDGSTIFTNAYLTVPPQDDRKSAAKWPDYYPAPLCLNRLKKSRALINFLGDDRNIPQERKAEYDMGNGNLPKKLKTHYIHEPEPNVFSIIEPGREIHYHNSQKELLYSLEAMKKGQYFKGKIYTVRKYANVLTGLLENTQLSFGKSRTAQYGSCELAADITVKDTEVSEVCAGGGEKIAVILESDAIFSKEFGGYTVRFEEVKDLIAKKFDIPYDKETDTGSILQTREITGYNTTWNLRRPGVPAVKAGSVLVYTIETGKHWQKKLDPGQTFVGEQNQEGYGQVRIMKCCDVKYAAGILEKKSDGGEEEMYLENCKPFLLRIVMEQILERLIFLYTVGHSKLNLTASTVGRLSLMLRESLNQHRNNPDQAFQDFCSRIASIKRTREREEAFRLLLATVLKNEKMKETGKYELDIPKMISGEDDSRLEELQKLLRKYLSDEELGTAMAAIWGVYMENILTFHKYRKKQEGGDEKYAQ